MSSMSQSTEDNNLWPVTALTPTTLQWWVSIFSNSRICKEKRVQLIILQNMETAKSRHIRLWFLWKTMLPAHLVYSRELGVWHQLVVPPATESSIPTYNWSDAIYQHSQPPTRDHPYTRNNYANMNAVIFDRPHPRNLKCNHDVRVYWYWTQESVQSCQCFRHSNVLISSFCRHCPIHCNWKELIEVIALDDSWFNIFFKCIKMFKEKLWNCI